MVDEARKDDDSDKLGLAVRAALLRFRIPIVVLLALLGLAFAWDAWHQGLAGRTQTKVAEEGARLQVAERDILRGVIADFDKARTSAGVARAIEAGDRDGAAKAFTAQWPDAREVTFVTPDLAGPYSDPATFGFGRVAVLDATLRDHATRVAVARVDGKPMLVFAGNVESGGSLRSLVVAALPTDRMSALITESAPGSGFLSLHFHGYDIATAGDSSVALMGKTGMLPLLDNGFFVMTASPAAPESFFGWGQLVGYILAAALLLAGIGWFHYSRRLASGAASAGGESPELTMADALAAEPQPERKASVPDRQKPAVPIDRSIFRAYDIRGVVGKSLDAGVARMIGQAIGSVMQDQGLRDIVVGRDGRLSSAELSNALIEGLRAAGREVIDIGEAPTPLCYFGAFHLRTGSCVAVTGSHNPPDYNGFKIVLGGETLAGEAVEALYTRIADDNLYKSTTLGSVQQRDIAPDYTQRIAEDVQLERKLKVVVDCGNGVAGMLAPEVLEAIGCEVLPIFCEVDGTFPNHHPDPSDPKNLTDSIQMVQRMKADIGLAFDGDGDRLGVVTPAGEIIYADRLLMLFAADVLERNPGACVVYDVKCTGHLAGHILRHGGSPLMWKTGHSLIKAKMKETGAELAGEMSGHFFFKERWYGFDDAIYAAARLLEILASRDVDADAVFAELYKGFSTPELKVFFTDGDPHKFVERFREKAKFEGARVATIDGVRADWPDGWGLVRASNTTPMLVMRFDADSPAALERIQGLFRAELRALKPDLPLPF